MSPQTPHTWEDNFLCWQYTPPPAPIDAGAPTTDAGAPRDASATQDAFAPQDAAAPRDAASDTPAAEDVQAVDIVVPGDVNILDDVVIADDADLTDAPKSDAGADTGFVDDLPAPEDVQLDRGPPPQVVGSSGCGCAVPGRRAPHGLGALSALTLASLFTRLRRRTRTPTRRD